MYHGPVRPNRENVLRRQAAEDLQQQSWLHAAAVSANASITTTSPDGNASTAA